MKVSGVNLRAIRGTVVGDKVWSETRVKGSGTGIVVGNFGFGRSKTTSNVQNKRETWIRTAQGDDISLVFNADFFKVLEGHDLAVVEARCGYLTTPSWAKNLSTGQDAPKLPLCFISKLWILPLLGAVPATISGALMASEGSLVGLLMVAGNILTYLYWRQHKSFRAAVEQVMREAESLQNAGES